MPLWLIIALVLAGIGSGTFAPEKFAYAFGQATLYVFLPPLIFEAAWNLDAQRLRAHWQPIFALAVPGVGITTLIVAAALVFAGIPPAAALLAGAMVSATDPLAITAIFRRIPVPAGLVTIVQSEALLNDAAAVVIYRALLLGIAGGFTVAAAARVTLFALLGVVGGALLGVLFGALLSRILTAREERLVQIAATVGGAYAVYFLADGVQASGIFAVIVFGVTLRAMERRFVSVQVAHAVERFWEAAALLANGCLFFLTGAALDIARVTREPFAESAALVGILLARLVLAYAVTPAALGRGCDVRWLHVINVAGARGALSLALALALPASLPMRPLIIDVVFTIVLATLLSSAFTVPAAVRGLRTSSPGPV